MEELRMDDATFEVFESVCATVLGTEVRRSTSPGPSPGERTLVGCVQITGAWSGAVLLSCAPGFASLAARTIFAGAGDPSVGEERDALGELANMVAGNLKALLPAPSYLGLPTVADGETGVLEVLGGMRTANVELNQLDRLITVLATTGSTAPFIGLFGTVWGILRAFQKIGATGQASIQVVGPDIAHALVATAVGLLAAIPAVMAYNFFNSRIKGIASEMDAFSSDFLNIVKRHYRGR